jgi:hypothetical protein
MQAYDPSANPLNGSEWAFPVLEILHLASIAMAVGTIAVVDLRLLGVGMRKWPASRLASVLDLWTTWGVLLAMITGAMLLSTDPANYLHNPAFRVKLVCLTAAVVYHYTMHARAAKRDESTLASKLAGAISIGLWLAVVFSGVFYAFV